MIIVLDSVFNIHGFWLNNANLIQYYRKNVMCGSSLIVHGQLIENTMLYDAVTKRMSLVIISHGLCFKIYYSIKVMLILFHMNYYSDIGPERFKNKKRH